jgi:hypothetical protein
MFVSVVLSAIIVMAGLHFLCDAWYEMYDEQKRRSKYLPVFESGIIGLSYFALGIEGLVLSISL